MPERRPHPIETRNVELNEQYRFAARRSCARRATCGLPSPILGTGMDRETQLRVFEPFFTTKTKSTCTRCGMSPALVAAVEEQLHGARRPSGP
jgi:hypothetical protein